MNVLESVSKPTLAGITAAGITRYVTYGTNGYGNNFAVEVQSKIPLINRLNGKRVNLALMTGLAVGSASLIADVVSDNLFDFLTDDQIMENIGSTAFQLSAVSAGAIGAHGIVNSSIINERGIVNIIALATATEVVSSYVHSKFIRPMFREQVDDVEYFF
jgi:hypothetical protein